MSRPCAWTTTAVAVLGGGASVGLAAAPTVGSASRTRSNVGVGTAGAVVGGGSAEVGAGGGAAGLGVQPIARVTAPTRRIEVRIEVSGCGMRICVSDLCFG